MVLQDRIIPYVKLYTNTQILSSSEKMQEKRRCHGSGDRPSLDTSDRPRDSAHEYTSELGIIAFVMSRYFHPYDIKREKDGI